MFFVCVLRSSKITEAQYLQRSEERQAGELIDRTIKPAAEDFNLWGFVFKLEKSQYSVTFTCTTRGIMGQVFIFINSRHRSGPDCRNAAVRYNYPLYHVVYVVVQVMSFLYL